MRMFKGYPNLVNTQLVAQKPETIDKILSSAFVKILQNFFNILKITLNV